jgi:hypothetical protein
MTATGVRGAGIVPRRARIYRTLYKGGYGYSHEVLAEEFGDTQKNVAAMIREAEKATKLLQREEVVELVIKFCKKNGRWPVGRDWCNKEGLPARSTIWGIFDRWGRSSWRRNGSMALAFDNLQVHVSTHPKLTARVALLIPNMTHRRDAMRRFSDVELVKHMTLVEDDKEVGMLYRWGTESTMLRVVNSTPEPDGSRSVYVLTAPPEMQHARQALAWSFGVTDGWEDFVIGEQS